MGGDGGRAGERYGVVLFDLDGTLADTVELILRCYRHTMATHLGSAPPDAEWLRSIGTPLRDQLRSFARDDDEAAAMLETYETFQRSEHDDLVSTYPGVEEAVASLLRRGARLGVVTSKRRAMAERTLRACGLTSAMEVLVTASDVERGKPDPEPVELALERMDLAGLTGEERRRRILFVGDSPFDVRAGRGAGVGTAGALWGPFPRHVLEDAGPTHLVEAAGEVPGLRP